MKNKGRRRIILSIDVGGSRVKMMTSAKRMKRHFDSGTDLTAKSMVEQVKQLTKDWSYDVISVGYPGPVLRNRPAAEPHNLGKGWKGFDFARKFGCPTKVVNDALMQALGGYTDGKMLFLGLGTGLGSAMIVDGALVPMELAHLPYRKGRTFEGFIGEAGLKRYGKRRWAIYVNVRSPFHGPESPQRLCSRKLRGHRRRPCSTGCGAVARCAGRLACAL
jgi:polyphosphate glucokinase